MLNDILIPQIQLDKVVVAFPALVPQTVVIVGVTAEVNAGKPADIGRILPILHHVLKRPETTSNMIEHAVQHNLDSFLVQIPTHFRKVFIGSKSRIYLCVVSCIISMGI